MALISELAGIYQFNFDGSFIMADITFRSGICSRYVLCIEQHA